MKRLYSEKSVVSTSLQMFKMFTNLLFRTGSSQTQHTTAQTARIPTNLLHVSSPMKHIRAARVPKGNRVPESFNNILVSCWLVRNIKTKIEIM